MGAMDTPGNAEQPHLVLIVDDDAATRAVLTDALTDEGYTVASAADGATALAEIDRLETAPQARRPAVILCDARMPVMDGAAFIRAYRERPGPKAPVIAISAATWAVDGSTNLAADAVLRKPFQLDELFALIAQLVDGGRV